MKVAKSLRNSQHEKPQLDQARRSRGSMILSRKQAQLADIPVLHSQKVVRLTRRFQSDSAVVGGAFTLASGHNQFLFALSTVAGYCLLDEWRINKVRLYAPYNDTAQEGNAILIPVGVELDSNYFCTPSITHQDTTGSRDRVAMVEMKPSNRTPMGSWHVANTVNPTGTLFTLSCTSGAILDIEFDVLYNYVFPLSGYTVVISGATLGSQYGKTIMTSFVPQGVNYVV
jgi:hypothetical protein